METPRPRDAGTKISRRTIAAGAAWAAPAVAYAAAAPAMAASGTIVLSVSGACKSPGSSTSCDKSYLFGPVKTQSFLNINATVKIISITSDDPATQLKTCSSATGVNFLIAGATYAISAGQTLTSFYLQQCSKNSADIAGVTWTICFSYLPDGETAWVGPACIELKVDGTPPDCASTQCVPNGGSTSTVAPLAPETTTPAPAPVTTTSTTKATSAPAPAPKTTTSTTSSAPATTSSAPTPTPSP